MMIIFSKKIVMLNLFFVVFTSSSFAMPKGPFSSEEERSQFLSRRISYLQQNRNLNKPLKLDKKLVLGTKKYLAILIKSKDIASTYDSTRFQDLLFSKGTHSTGSLRDYFTEVSNNKFDVQGDVFGFYTASQDYSYYVDGQSGLGDYPKNAVRLVEEAVDAADSAGVNFADYDNDKDGEVEGVWIVHQGVGAEGASSSTDIWSHKWDIVSGGGTARTYDGVRINNYIMQPETNAKGGLIEIGVFCHEFGHLLGLPELYDTDYSSCGNGIYDLMSGGAWGDVDKKHPESPAHLSAWSKYYLGWANVYDWTSVEGGRTLAQVETGNEIVKIDVEGSVKEYFLLCNRRKTGFDKYLPGEGLLIWHVDENRIDVNMKKGKLNDSESAQSISLMEADGQFNLREGTDSGGNDGDAGDYFPGTTGNTSFTSTSNPSSNKNNGERSGVSIRYIDIDSPSLVTFSLGSAGPSVASVGGTFCYPNPFKPSSVTKQAIIKYPNNLAVSLKIYNIAGEIVRTLDREGMDLLASKGEAYWDGKNDDGSLVSTGLYIYLIDSPQGKARGKILFVK